jgi:hypothetical protein
LSGSKRVHKEKRNSMMELKKYTGIASKKKRTATSSRVGLRKERGLL